jgi:hypothetical protein
MMTEQESFYKRIEKGVVCLEREAFVMRFARTVSTKATID